MNEFMADVIRGLSAPQKFLMSKYFYDKKGDAIFEEIMAMPEYYLTDCEWEIFSTQNAVITSRLLKSHPTWDVVEFGPGNAVKSGKLLEQMQQKGALGTYYPVDISENIICELEAGMSSKIQGISVSGFAGEYFDMLPRIIKVAKHPVLLLFLGGNIGNFHTESMQTFLRILRGFLKKDDYALIGFDLKKRPSTILNAYNDETGITARFNLNLLERMNRELNADFDLQKFEHYCCYDPLTGSCKSYLVSLANQSIELGDQRIKFRENETIFMEVSQKYSVDEIERHGADCGFMLIEKYYDSRKWFVDVLFK